MERDIQRAKYKILNVIALQRQTNEFVKLEFHVSLVGLSEVMESEVRDGTGRRGEVSYTKELSEMSSHLDPRIL